MASFKHNKKRNSGLVYEFLIRRLSKTMIENDRAGYQKALAITRKYFGDGAPLAEEKELFDVLRNTRGVTESAARRVLTEVVRTAQHLDRKHLEIKKSNLIKEINYAFGKNFFSEHRIPDYRLLATIQQIIDSARPQALTETVQKIQLEEALVAHMITTEQSMIVAPKEEIDNVVMLMAAKRFNEKYSKTLNSGQKVLLEKYIRSLATGDEYPLFQHMLSEVNRIQDVMTRAMNLAEVKQDTEMQKRLNEARESFKGLVTTKATVSDALIEEVMLYQKLCEEIESDE